MGQKLLKLIRILLMHTNDMTASGLAAEMGVSERSIKNYISEINDNHPQTILSSRKGYTIKAEAGRKILNDSGTHIPQSSQERMVYIINLLIKQEDGIDAYDLCDTIYISYSTLKNELGTVKKKLIQFDLKLLNQKDNLSIDGLEKNKRRLLSSILYDESNINFVSLKTIQHVFPDIEIEYIKNTLLNIFDKYQYFVNDYSLINIVLHIAIAIDRIKNHNINTQDVKELAQIRLHEYELASQVTKELENHFHITYSEAEIYELALLLISRATTIDYKSITTANLEDFIGKECFDLVEEMIQSVNAYYYIDLSEPEFLIRFAIHIRNLLQRSKNQQFSKNPLTDEIKTSCPLIYDVSVYLSGIIKDRTGIIINDDEIAYITFHLGSTLEAQKSLNKKVTAILYCPNYYDLNIRLTDTINQHFSCEMLITNIITDDTALEQVPKCDFIMSTVPLHGFYGVDIVHIGMFFTDKDISVIRNKITSVRINKRKATFKNYLEQLIIPEFFERRNDLKTEGDAIEYLAGKMYRLGYVNETFREDIYMREKLSSTAFHDFAIPHAMKMHADKTGLNILISDSPVSWNGKPVFLIIMMCFNKNDRYIFNEIFEPLTMMLTDREFIKKLIQVKDHETFIQMLTDNLEVTF